MSKTKFKEVDARQDFVKLENELFSYWQKEGIVKKYLEKNSKGEKKFSFLDGPITANNPMGVHHAWGRTYKDLFQRFFNMKGYQGRFQNGFDEQGLWVEVEVEKELGFKNKKDIEKYGIDKFVSKCKERVLKYSNIQTEQSKRLGYFMDWENSYHTSSDENNYAIWNFLKVVNSKGWLYKGHDSVPWCPRCGTAISQHEISTEEYKTISHETVYFKLPIKNRKNEFLLVWTTTPWTIPANVAIAINPKMEYVKAKYENEIFYVAEKRLSAVKELEKIQTISSSELLGLEYEAPFDHLPIVQKSFGDYVHMVIDGGDVVTEDEGTGLLHVAPGAGTEDFKLGKENSLPTIAPIEEDASYVTEMGELASKNAKKEPEIIINFLKENNGGKFLFKTEKYKHQYPVCWRCKSELVWRVVDEWYIAMDKVDESGKSYREQMKDVAKIINWNPSWGKERELDWLKNMHDWLISKKRYWGLALPVWECANCHNFEVIGSKEELKEKAVEGWSAFEGNSPHRPWIDNVKIKCSKCEEVISRIPDVGNPWLDAGIVPFSTMPEGWFPADFVTESFPGQFKNWFYALIAMSTAQTNKAPFKNLLGFATVVDESGNPMHKSTGNAIEFNDAAEKAGADAMRWVYATQNPEINLKFGYNVISETRRKFIIVLWNCYKYFVDYANLANWKCEDAEGIENKLTVLDKWILSSLTKLVVEVNSNLESFNAAQASRQIEKFVSSDLSTWYIRRSRERVGAAKLGEDQNVFLSTLYGVLVATSKLIAPFVPFIAEEIYKNLTSDESVHLTTFPQGDKSLLDEQLILDMEKVRSLAELGHSKRKEENIKLRQPLSSLSYSAEKKLDESLEKILLDELNVKKIESFKKSENLKLSLDTKITSELKEEGEAREIIRTIQQLRKEAGCDLKEEVIVELPSWPESYQELILKETLTIKIEKGSEAKVKRVQ